MESQRERLINDLKDFFEGRNKFTAAEDYYGMASSQRNNLFVAYYANLSAAEKKEMAHLIVLGAIGQLEEIQKYLSKAVLLSLGLCIRDYAQYFQDEIIALEKEFNNSENIKLWIRATNEPPEDSGLGFKKTWNYGLSLYNILRRLNSEKLKKTYEYLISHAESEWFRNALQENS